LTPEVIFNFASGSLCPRWNCIFRIGPHIPTCHRFVARFPFICCEMLAFSVPELLQLFYAFAHCSLGLSSGVNMTPMALFSSVTPV
jgi:hypothetical protein